MTTTKLHNTLLAAAMVAGGMIMGTAPAYATQGVEFIAIDSLHFDVGTAVPGLGIDKFLSVTDTQLVWRDLAPEGPSGEAVSQLNIDGASNSAVSIFSDMGWYTIADIQHVNTVILGGVFNFTIDVNDSFTLTQGGNPVLALPNIPLHVAFTETPNLASNAACVAAYGVNPVGSLCDDIFAVSNLDLVITSFFFPYAGESWKITFDILALVDAGTAFDGNTPAGGGTIYTAETDNSRLQVRARIDQVPEPGTLALLGIGVLGLQLAARRAAKKA